MSEPKHPGGRPQLIPGDPVAGVGITLPVSILTEIERDRAEMAGLGDKDPGRSGIIATILRDHYDRRAQKELQRAS